ncbi:MAG: NRDE family protein [Bacteroidia bacterium]
MCLILFGYRVHPGYPLIIAANRDEFYARPTLRAGWWEENPAILAGKDLQAGGTWLGVSKSGRFAAVTNFREPNNIKPQAPSRGALVTRFLEGQTGTIPYLDHLSTQAEAYNGFNLLTFDSNTLGWYSNRHENPEWLDPGVYGLSNHLLNTAWPKVQQGKERLAALISPETEMNPESLFEMLNNDTIAPDDRLPSTGVSLELERMLSAMCIKSPTYGTRVSTVVLIDHSGKVYFEERAHVPEGLPVKFAFQPVPQL